MFTNQRNRATLAYSCSVWPFAKDHQRQRIREDQLNVVFIIDVLFPERRQMDFDESGSSALRDRQWYAVAGDGVGQYHDTVARSASARWAQHWRLSTPELLRIAAELSRDSFSTARCALRATVYAFARPEALITVKTPSSGRFYPEPPRAIADESRPAKQL